jgi:hypothetical protein
MDDDQGNMVMRSVYLPLGMDQELRSLAFTLGRSKGDLIREFVDAGLEKLRASPPPAIAAVRDSVVGVIESALATRVGPVTASDAARSAVEALEHSGTLRVMGQEAARPSRVRPAGASRGPARKP